MSDHKNFLVRCRAIIVHEGKLLVMKHRSETPHFVLPGGHMDQGEDVLECITREIFEELGIAPTIGRLLYVYTFAFDGVQSVEFLFEVKNGADYFAAPTLGGTHAHEFVDVRWVSPNEEGIRILPSMVQEDFAKGTLLSDEVHYRKGEMK